jgi:hypothetical protein
MLHAASDSDSFLGGGLVRSRKISCVVVWAVSDAGMYVIFRKTE